MIELTILGRSGRYPERGGGCSAYLVRDRDTTILMDMGSGSIARFQDYVSIGDIDGIVFSHLHGDHMCDFLPFNYMMAYKKNEIIEPIEIYMPATPIDIHDVMVSNATYAHFHDVSDGDTVNIGTLSITFMRVNHPVECYAMRITNGESTLLFTGDTNLFDGIEGIFEGADTVLGDACVLDAEWSKKSPHLSVKSLAELSRASRLILTHLPDNETDIRRVYDEACSVHDDVIVAEVGVTYDI